jgi:hypothetical protein
MQKFIGLSLMFISVCLVGQNTFRDGVMTGSDNYFPVESSGRQFTIVDSFTGPFSYSNGIAHDGRYVWNSQTWSPPCSVARIDPETHMVVRIFNPSYGERDMTFDGTYIWISHWSTNSIYKYDTANFSLVASYDPPFAGHAHGLAWDGAYLWVGEESGRIYKMNTTGDTIRSIPFNAPYSYDPRGMGFAAGHLWIGHQGYGRIYEIDTTDGAILNFYPAPGHVAGWNFQQGVDFGGGYLWTTSGGTYNRIYKIDIGLTPVEEHEKTVVSKIGIDVTPNPSHGAAMINLSVTRPTSVTLKVVDASGRTVATVFADQNLAAGNYRYRLPDGLSRSGVYFIVLKADGSARSVKLVLTK